MKPKAYSGTFPPTTMTLKRADEIMDFVRTWGKKDAISSAWQVNMNQNQMQQFIKRNFDRLPDSVA